MPCMYDSTAWQSCAEKTIHSRIGLKIELEHLVNGFAVEQVCLHAD